MGTTVANSSTRTASWTGWLTGVGLGIVGCALIWLAVSQLERAQLVMASTFEFQWDRIAIAQFLFLMVGVVFTVIVLMALDGSNSRPGLLVGGAIPPLGLLLYFWQSVVWGFLPSPLQTGMMWSVTGEAQTAELTAVAAMLTALIWQSVKGRGHDPDDS
jgi:hypothetical protein